MNSQLKFSISKCETSFVAFDAHKRCEVRFIAKPKSFTITTYEDFLITEFTDYAECGDKIEVAIASVEFFENAHGFLTPFTGSFINIALSFSEQQMVLLNNFIVNDKFPTELQISIEGVELQNRNFKMQDEQYKIASWSFKI